MRNPATRFGALVGVLLLAAALAPAPAGASDKPLAFVPVDAAAVGMVRIDQLKSSPFAPQILRETDRATTNGEAARFLEEAGLDPRRDIDTAVFALLGTNEGNEPQAIAILEGRFDVAKLSAATAARGAARIDLGRAGSYFRLPENSGSHHRNEQGAVAFLDATLTLAGHEEAVERVLTDRAAGNAAFSRKSTLGRAWNRLDKNASAWALVDAEKARSWRGVKGRGDDGPHAAFAQAMQGVTVLAFGARLAGADVEFEAFGLAPEEETRELLEDALRGLTAAWRMAVQQRHPEMVPIIRKFEIVSNDEGVSISGKVPAEYLRKGERNFDMEEPQN
jgi:hypothetical protein